MNVTGSWLVRRVGDGMLTDPVLLADPDQTSVLDLMRINRLSERLCPRGAGADGSGTRISRHCGYISKAMLNAPSARDRVDEMIPAGPGLRFSF
jgi:hypothetical protein